MRAHEVESHYSGLELTDEGNPIYKGCLAKAEPTDVEARMSSDDFDFWLKQTSTLMKSTNLYQSIHGRQSGHPREPMTLDKRIEGYVTVGLIIVAGCMSSCLQPFGNFVCPWAHFNMSHWITLSGIIICRVVVWASGLFEIHAVRKAEECRNEAVAVSATLFQGEGKYELIKRQNDLAGRMYTAYMTKWREFAEEVKGIRMRYKLYSWLCILGFVICLGYGLFHGGN